MIEWSRKENCFTLNEIKEMSFVREIRSAELRGGGVTNHRRHLVVPARSTMKNIFPSLTIHDTSFKRNELLFKTSCVDRKLFPLYAR